MTVDIRDIEDLVRRQETWRGRETINLIASENAQSRAVRDVQNSDFMARYAEGHPNEGGKVNRYYQGTRCIDEIERKAKRGSSISSVAARPTFARSAAMPRTRDRAWLATRRRQASSSTRRMPAVTSATISSASSGAASRYAVKPDRRAR